MEGANSCGAVKLPQDLMIRVAALNNIKSVVENTDLFSTIDFIQKYNSQSNLTILIEMTLTYLNDLKATIGKVERDKIKKFIRNVLLSLNEEPKANDITLLLSTHLFTRDELSEISKIKQFRAGTQVKDIVLPAIATMSDWIMSDTRSMYNRFAAQS